MSEQRILFMGTPAFAVGILKHLVEAKKQIVGVVTAPDKPAGRGKQLRSSAVKQYAEEQGMLVLQPTNLKSDEFQDDLKRLDPDVIIVVAFRMLPKVVWNYPRNGTFNLHASLLPQYRGAAPINWAIINGEKQTGVTTFFIDEAIDTGEIIDSKSVPIDIHDNVETLHDKLMILGAELVQETVEAIERGNVKSRSQKEELMLKAAPKLTRGNTKINWEATSHSIENFVRGLNPFPTAWTELVMKDKILKIKVFKVSSVVKLHTAPIGSSCYDKERKSIKVAVKDGFIYLKELQLPGKKKMDAQSLVNGMGWKKDYKFI